MNKVVPMASPRLHSQLSTFLTHLASESANGEESLESLTDMSATLGISVATLREELQVARALGLVEVKPRTGIKILPYQFTPAVSKSLSYAVRVDRQMFRQFSDLRNHVEASYWYQAVSGLTNDDIAKLHAIIESAFQKLNSDPIQIPHKEHRQLHLTIYSRMENLFVLGILESYWDIYEAVGLSVYEDRKYLDRVWTYHRQMVDAIANGDFLSGYQSLITHMDLLFQREQSNSKLPFE
jgi:DNA-binding FadR family transcriptional regulator